MTGILAVLLCAAAVETKAPGDAALLDAVRDEVRQSAIPGAALVVVRDGRVSTLQTFGLANVDTGAAVSPDTLFQVGSLTKPVTAMAALALVDEGTLSLDAPVSRYVTDLPAAIGSITIAQLLSQTSGLLDEPAENGPHDETALASFVAGWSAERRAIQPGSFSYSNPGYALLGLVLQRAAGAPYADVVTDRVLKPLGMAHATFRPGMAITHAVAAGHRAEDGRATVVRPLADDTRFWPAGYLMVSAADLGRFVTALLNGPRIASMAAPAARFPHVLDGDGYGYGLFVDESHRERVAGHGGQMPGFSARITLVPSRRAGLVLLANLENVRFAPALERFLDEMAGPVRTEPPAAGAEPLSAADAAAYAGTYHNRWTMEVVADGTRLLLRWAGADREMTRVGPDLFRVAGPGGPVTLQAVRSGDGRVAGLQMFVWTFARAR